VDNIVSFVTFLGLIMELHVYSNILLFVWAHGWVSVLELLNVFNNLKNASILTSRLTFNDAQRDAAGLSCGWYP